MPATPLPVIPKLVLGCVLWISVLVAPAAAVLPPDFFEETVLPQAGFATGLTFYPDGRMLLWDKRGMLLLIDDSGELPHEPLLDLRDEVGDWRDHGLLTVALDPAFTDNGHLYLYYVVDRHHLDHAGTPEYDPSANEYFTATIARLARYTASEATGFTTVDPASRLVLVGQDASSGVPILHESHAGGGLAFGHDGSLLLSTGDGASFAGPDHGGPVAGSYAVEALERGIIAPKEDVGAFRAQLVDALNGKVLRLDPATGQGKDDNPFFDPAAPSAARSRVWALGLRNPFRLAVQPERFGAALHDGPGLIVVGDVGGHAWEEIDIVAEPGANLGWPIYEGMEHATQFLPYAPANLDAPNPLFDGGACSIEHFSFRDLLVQDTLAEPFFANPCDSAVEIPATIPRFVHRRPAIDYASPGPARASAYAGTAPIITLVGGAGAPVAGPQFGGSCSIGGAWPRPGTMPEPFQDACFHGDFGSKWIQAVRFDGLGRPYEVVPFHDDAGRVVAVTAHPRTGELHYLRYVDEGQPEAQVRRIRYLPGGNQPPTAVASADVTWGAAPLAVQFDGTASFDPELGPLEYRWSFGDGTPDAFEAAPAHVFEAPAGEPTAFEVVLTVTDDAGAESTAALQVHANNSPPEVVITSPRDGSVYPLDGESIWDLDATIFDAEHASETLACAWRVILHHEDHIHVEPADPACTTTAVISPVGCSGESYHYELALTVTDPPGLATTRSVFLYPPCAGCAAADLDGDGQVAIADLLAVLAAWGPCSGACPADIRPDGTVDVQDLLAVLAAWGPCEGP